MDDIARLIAVEEIKKLKARYYRLMDTKQYDALAAVFTPDAVFDLSEVNSVRHPISGEWQPPYDPTAVYRGRDSVVAMIRNATASIVTVHHGHMPEIEILSETEATGIWSMEDIIRKPDGALILQGFGHYHERYARLPTGWAIKHTKITRLSVKQDELVR